MNWRIGVVRRLVACATLLTGCSIVLAPSGHVGSAPDAGVDAGVCSDVDGDGYRASDCGGDDCDDHDARRHPFAEITCGNGRRETCAVHAEDGVGELAHRGPVTVPPHGPSGAPRFAISTVGTRTSLVVVLAPEAPLAGSLEPFANWIEVVDPESFVTRLEYPLSALGVPADASARSVVRSTIDTTATATVLVSSGRGLFACRVGESDVANCGSVTTGSVRGAVLVGGGGSDSGPIPVRYASWTDTGLTAIEPVAGAPETTASWGAAGAGVDVIGTAGTLVFARRGSEGVYWLISGSEVSVRALPTELEAPLVDVQHLHGTTYAQATQYSPSAVHIARLECPGECSWGEGKVSYVASSTESILDVSLTVAGDGVGLALFVALRDVGGRRLVAAWRVESDSSLTSLFTVPIEASPTTEFDLQAMTIRRHVGEPAEMLDYVVAVGADESLRLHGVRVCASD